jgi:hypothetical protein
MANVFTALAPTLFSAAKEVAQEPIGALDSINLSFDSKGVAIGDSVTIPIAPAASVSAFTPAMYKAEGTSKTAESTTVTIDNNNEVMWHLTGEQQRSLQNAESDKDWVAQLVKQGMRALRNDAESKLCSAIYKGASRAYGTAATTPFATTIDDIPNIYKMLRDNGAPMSDLQLIVNTSAGLNLRKLGIIQQADQAGTDAERRTGNFLRQFGFAIKESAGVASHTKGTATGFQIAAAGEAIGQTTLSFDGGDAGTIIAGDVLTIGTGGGSGTGTDYDTKYVINDPSTLTGAASGNVIIGRPGLKVARVNDDEGVIGGSYTANMAFERSAVVGVMRPPIIPPSPIINQMLITDDKGLSYLLCETVGFGEITWSLHLAYGFKVINSEYVVNLLG